MATASLAARLAAALPQTQCTRCGYPDCAAYAHAMAQGEADINRCPPGGAEGIARLATITGHPLPILDPEVGVEEPRGVAVIDEDWCIGCTLCLAACPTDTIVGANKFMHTVVPEHCTGCALCVPACPVDCIAMENASGQATGWAAWSLAQAADAQARYAARQSRLARADEADRAGDLASAGADKQSTIEAALARARARRSPS
ncbi:MAG: RnfABCDGE type electron transport complex subunit B [Burkholderiaceae bacterium]|jgi:electron transport complex protein RnfB|nr:RnfABCDGE type electron transport complex subunit B [Burkholderiaceae bacterium]MCO5103220.1 RnfABCDGE type electron transport complex subunit B [Burkholderiaceae bacterium]